MGAAEWAPDCQAGEIFLHELGRPVALLSLFCFFFPLFNLLFLFSIYSMLNVNYLALPPIFSR
jgi:hypothetical protein